MAVNSLGTLVTDSLIKGKDTTHVNMHDSDMHVKTRAVTQNEDNIISNATPSLGHAEKNDNTFSHNRYLALDAYINPEGKDKKSAEENFKALTEVKTSEEKMQDLEDKVKGKVADDDDKRVKDEKQDRNELSEEEKEKVQELKARDTEVRVHEQAHKAAGGALASAPSYEYETGPDGKRYVVEGHVDIDVSEGKTPQETIEKMQTVQRAANAPAEPSGADRQVAAEAAAKEAQARAELAKEQLDNQEEKRVSANKSDERVVEKETQEKEAEQPKTQTQISNQNKVLSNL